MLKCLEEAIKRGIEIKEINNLPFVTIWKTGKLYGFNFDNKPIGYETKQFGVTRKVVGVF